MVGIIHGGPYRNKPKKMFGVKMAKEIDRPCDVDIPTEDFSVPDKKVMAWGLFHAYRGIKKHGVIYAGCMGGIGRTGLFMALMLRLAYEARTSDTSDRTDEHIGYLREHYHPHSVETPEQREYVRNFNLFWLKLAVRFL